MDMEKVTIDSRKPHVFEEGPDRYGLSEPLETSDMAINYYRVAPGEGFPSGLHTHMDQEEVFVVIDGEATFETLAPQSGADCANGKTVSEDGEIVVGEGEAIRFAPGEFQSGKNESDGELAVLAMGAPRDSEDIRIPADCPQCHHDDLRLDTDKDGLSFVCPDCEAEHFPQDCPECGHDDLRITLDEAAKTVVICQDCGTIFENPPLRH